MRDPLTHPAPGSGIDFAVFSHATAGIIAAMLESLMFNRQGARDAFGILLIVSAVSTV